MDIKKGKIANALTSVAINHIVATTDDLYDEEMDLYQNDINKLISGDLGDLKRQLSASTEIILEKISASTDTVLSELQDSEHGLVAIKNAIDGIEKTDRIDDKSIIDIFK